jgi:hypothetical protein
MKMPKINVTFWLLIIILIVLYLARPPSGIRSNEREFNNQANEMNSPITEENKMAQEE